MAQGVFNFVCVLLFGELLAWRTNLKCVLFKPSFNEKQIRRRTGLEFARCFGDKGNIKDISDADIISTIEFDHNGDYLTTGDKGGQVVLFDCNDSKKGDEYKFFTDFQSHEPEFDYLKSLEIEEKINKIKWCRHQNSAHFLLSTNNKTIKLWKVLEKKVKLVSENNLGAVSQPKFYSASNLKLPKMTLHNIVVTAAPQRIYANAHAYHINSISVNSGGKTYISADDLRVNLYYLSILDKSFNIVDIKLVKLRS